MTVMSPKEPQRKKSIPDHARSAAQKENEWEDRRESQLADLADRLSAEIEETGTLTPDRTRTPKR